MRRAERHARGGKAGTDRTGSPFSSGSGRRGAGSAALVRPSFSSWEIASSKLKCRAIFEPSAKVSRAVRTEPKPTIFILTVKRHSVKLADRLKVSARQLGS